jgi:uncharacterized membrane protein
MLHLHPAIVHFPIAMLTFSTFVGVYNLFRPSPFLTDLLFWLIAAGVISSFAGIISGLTDESFLKFHADQKRLLQLHELTGYLTVFIYTGLLFWLIIRKKQLNGREMYIYNLVSVAACIILIYQGYIGGEMVYKNGIGVECVEKK